MAITKEQKAEILGELNDKFGRAKGIVFAQYSGLSVEDAQDLRRGLRDANIDYKVAKKTLVKLAAKEAGLELTDDVMAGPIGLAFGYDDEVAAAQKMAEFAKKFDSIQLMGGVMEGKIITLDMVKTLADIPSRDVLIAKFMGSLMSPVQGFAGLLNNVSGSFVRVVNAVREKMEEEGGAPAPVEEAPAEEKAEEPAEEPKEEAPAEEAPAEEPKEEAAEAPAEEAKEEAPAEEAEAPKEEAAEEAPAEEEKSEE